MNEAVVVQNPRVLLCGWVRVYEPSSSRRLASVVFSAGVAAIYSEKQTRRPTEPPSPPRKMPRVQRARPFRWPGRVWLSVIISVLCWLLLWAAVGVLIQMLIDDREKQEFAPVFFWLFGLYLFFRLWGFLQALRVKCPLCHGQPLHQKNCRMHKDARKILVFNYRISTVLDILGDGEFTCMYCGTPFRLKK